ncbi:TPA: ribosome-associated translation inhibitor RaiA [Candidatus Azambacteria bacterium]|nr:ribosome-associated translation inhibitor RaiA [Candidatus Azambacteria bacterium]
MMKINIKATNLELSGSVNAYIDEKINGLEKFIQNVDLSAVECWVEVAKTTTHHRKGDIYRAEADIRLPGKVIRAEAEQWDLHQAIDQIKDELQRELKKYKEAQSAKYKRGARIFKTLSKLSPLAWFQGEKGERAEEE